CPHCREELPMVDDVGAAFAPLGVRTLAVSLDDDPEDFARLLEELSPRFPLVRVLAPAPGALADAMRAMGGHFRDTIPYVAIVDRNGHIARDWPPQHPSRHDLEESLRSLADPLPSRDTGG